MLNPACKLLLSTLLLAITLPALAHHVLGRPSYSLSADSNTPPSMQVETQIGDFYVTYMAFPAFPQPGEQGRVNLYAVRIDDNSPFTGDISFSARDDGWLDAWFPGDEELIGTQPPDDGVHRQSFVIKEAGDYIITARFESGGEPYVIDFPLRIGEPAPVGPIGIAVGVIVAVLLWVNVVKRKRRVKKRRVAAKTS